MGEPSISISLSAGTPHNRALAASRTAGLGIASKGLNALQVTGYWSGSPHDSTGPHDPSRKLLDLDDCRGHHRSKPHSMRMKDRGSSSIRHLTATCSCTCRPVRPIKGGRGENSPRTNPFCTGAAYKGGEAAVDRPGYCHQKYVDFCDAMTPIATDSAFV